LSDWVFAQRDAAQQLCQLHQFGIKSQQATGEVEFIITVREYVTPPDPTMKFFAQADKQTNQSVAAFTPSGWGKTMVEALDLCIRAIGRFPYPG